MSRLPRRTMPEEHVDAEQVDRIAQDVRGSGAPLPAPPPFRCSMPLDVEVTRDLERRCATGLVPCGREEGTREADLNAKSIERGCRRLTTVC